MQHDSTCNRAFLSQQRVDVFNNCHISVSWAANYTFVPAWADGPYDSSSQNKLPVSVSFSLLNFVLLGWTSLPGDEPVVGNRNFKGENRSPIPMLASLNCTKCKVSYVFIHNRSACFTQKR